MDRASRLLVLSGALSDASCGRCHLALGAQEMSTMRISISRWHVVTRGVENKSAVGLKPI